MERSCFRWGLYVNMLSRRQIAVAAIGGGLLGSLAGAFIDMIVGADDVVHISELFVGGWLGFALACAIMMIFNIRGRGGSV